MADWGREAPIQEWLLFGHFQTFKASSTASTRRQASEAWPPRPPDLVVRDDAVCALGLAACGIPAAKNDLVQCAQPGKPSRNRPACERLLS